jgi:ATP-binding cassette subfamily F protein 3
MILLTLTDVTKHYGPDPVLAGVSFDVRPGERVSLVGPNGAGKTTLMRIIAGSEAADGGSVERHPAASVGYLQQQPEFAPGRTVWEEAKSALDGLLGFAHEAEALGHAIGAAGTPQERKRLEQRLDFVQHQLHHHDVYNIDYKIERILDGLGFARTSYTQPVVQLSGGQQNRLLLAKLLLEEPDLMLLDEPSNHLDIDATEWLENFLLESQQALLVVSHDRYFLDRVTGRTLELYQGTVDSYPGNFTQYKRLKAARLELQQKAFVKQQEEIADLQDYIRRYQFGVRHAQAEDRRKKLERLELAPRPRAIGAPAMSFPRASRTGDIVLRVEHLSKAYARPLFHDLSFDILRGEKWGVLGPNGTGKTTLLKCLLGLEPADAGQVVLGTGVKVGYFDQMLSGIDPELEVLDAVRPGHKDFLQQQRRDALARFGVAGEMVHQKVGSLSGGERNRVALTLLSALDANVLILDEPTNHLDLWARDALERALGEFDGSVLFVSHDRYFLNQVATKMMVVEPVRFRVIDGNYETYQHLVRRGLAQDARATVAEGKSLKSSPAAAKGRAAKEPRRKRKFPYRKTPDIEAEIAQREARHEELQQLFSSPAVLRDGSRVKQLKADLDENDAALALLYEHWEEASEMN